MNNPLISIIIVNWNGKKWLKNCLDSIYEQKHKEFEIIFIDNDSKDDSVEYVQRKYPKVRITKNSENLGFGRANNLGAEKATGEILFLLNNDTVINNKDFLGKIVLYKRSNELDIIGPKIINYEGADIYESRKLSIDCTGYLGWAKKTFYVEGCALLIDRKAFLKLNGFDEKYFMYSEDIDLCWRAHLVGMKVGICNDVSLKHFGGGSSETTQLKKKQQHVVPLMRKYEVEKNNLRNILKNYSWHNLLWVVPLSLLQIMTENLFFLVLGQFSVAKENTRAITWNGKNINSTIKKRREVQKTRTVSDRKIMFKMSTGLNKLRALLIIGLPKYK